jgi:hypothetical protein
LQRELLTTTCNIWITQCRDARIVWTIRMRQDAPRAERPKAGDRADGVTTAGA